MKIAWNRPADKHPPPQTFDGRSVGPLWTIRLLGTMNQKTFAGNAVRSTDTTFFRLWFVVGGEEFRIGADFVISRHCLLKFRLGEIQHIAIFHQYIPTSIVAWLGTPNNHASGR